MIAVWLHEFGGPEMLVAEETPVPIPGPAQVLIQVAFANVAFIETQLRSGRDGPYRLSLPTIPGNGVGGVVTGVGSEADQAWLGARVVAGTGGSGGYSEYVAVDAATLIAVPEGLALDEAAAMLGDGRTAMMLMETAAPMAGERVLIEAAGGGVGTCLVQLAKSAGATVIAVAGGADKLSLATELGADAVIDYRSSDWTEQVNDAVGGVDLVVDGVGGEIAAASFGLLVRGGRMISFGLASGTWAPVTEEAAAANGVTLLRPPRLDASQAQAYAERALAEAAGGRLRPVVGQVFPLARAGEAHAAIESRATRGRTLLIAGQR